MKLTPAQIAFFQTFGYLAMPGLLADDIDWITEEFEWAIQNEGGGVKHDGSKRTMFGGPIERRSRACTILDHPKIQGLIAGVIGDDFNYCSGDGNYYSGDTGWHPDGNWGQLFAVKVAFYLDPLTPDTGALRVIPASHRPDHFVRSQRIDPNQSRELFGIAPRDFPGCVALSTVPGDIVMFNHDLYHAAFGGSQRRRMFTMNCTRHAHSPQDMETARAYLRQHSPGGYNVRTGAGMFFPPMLDSASPQRMKHLQQPCQIHDELFPHLARTA
jgi:hypothetical protein